MRVLPLAVAFALAGFHASAESGAPATDTDLRAFYCHPVVHFLAEAGRQLPRPPASALAADPDLAKAVAIADAQLAVRKDEARRLDQYVEGRAIELGGNSPIAASRRGWDDIELLKVELACAARPAAYPAACRDAAAERAKLQERLSLCTNVQAWLP